MNVKFFYYLNLVIKFSFIGLLSFWCLCIFRFMCAFLYVFCFYDIKTTLPLLVKLRPEDPLEI